MKVVCAWCEEEGKHTLLNEGGAVESPMASHGICRDHERMMVKSLADMKRELMLLRPRHDPGLSRGTRPSLAPGFDPPARRSRQPNPGANSLLS